MISVLIVVDNFNIGGPQKSLLALLDELDYRKYAVSFLSLTPGGALLSYLPADIHLLDTPEIDYWATLPKEGFLHRCTTLLRHGRFRVLLPMLYYTIVGTSKKNMMPYKQKFWQHLQKQLVTLPNQYDVAIAVTGGFSIPFVADCVQAKKKIGWVRTDYHNLKRDYKLDDIYFHNFDNIFTVSKQCKEIFDQLFPAAAAKTVVLYNLLPHKLYSRIPADTSCIDTSNGTVKLMTICRLDPFKGLDMAIEAAVILQQRGIDFRWFILGDGVYRDTIEHLIAENNLQEHMILLGFQLNTYRFLEKCDIFVHPSRFEGKSNAVDEGKFLCKPIAATRYPTVGEQLIDSHNGMVAEMNGASLAEAIIKLIQDDSLRNTLTNNLCEEKQEATFDTMRTFTTILEQ